MSTQRTTLSGRDIASGDSSGAHCRARTTPRTPSPPREVPGRRVPVEVPDPLEGVTDRDQSGRRQDGREVEPRLRPAGDREAAVTGRVLGEQVAHVHPQSPAPRSVDARGHADLERPVVRRGGAEERRSRPV
jgi:hypothetical protein